MTDTQPLVKDYQPPVSYFRFTPDSANSIAGVACTPLMGEVVEGRIYKVTNPDVVGQLRSHPEWSEVSSKEFNAQIKADAADKKE